MKITRRQLNNIIREELQINEVIPVLVALPTIIASLPAAKIAALGAAIAAYVVIDKKMDPISEKVWNSPEFAEMRGLLETIGTAAKKLPEAAKRGVVKSIEETVNGFLDSLKIGTDTESEEQPEQHTPESSDEEVASDSDDEFPESPV